MRVVQSCLSLFYTINEILPLAHEVRAYVTTNNLRQSFTAWIKNYMSYVRRFNPFLLLSPRMICALTFRNTSQTDTRLTASFSGQPGDGSGISWVVCKSLAPCPRQITMRSCEHLITHVLHARWCFPKPGTARRKIQVLGQTLLLRRWPTAQKTALACVLQAHILKLVTYKQL